MEDQYRNQAASPDRGMPAAETRPVEAAASQPSFEAEPTQPSFEAEPTQPSFEAEPPRHVNPYDPSFTAKTGETYTPPQPSFDARDGRWDTQAQPSYDPSGNWTPTAQPSFEAQSNRWEQPQYGQSRPQHDQPQYDQPQQTYGQQVYGDRQVPGNQPYGDPRNFPAQNYDMGTQTDAYLDKLGRRALILGIASVITWLFPLLGYATSLIGLSAARKGVNSPNYADKAKLGRVLCLVGLGLSLFNSIIAVIHQMAL